MHTPENKETNKVGIIRSVFAAFFWPILAPLRFGWIILKRIWSLISLIFKEGPMVIVESFRAAKIAWGSRKDKTLSFKQVCQNWGIYEEEQIPIGAKNFRTHALVWLVVISFAVYQSVVNLDSLGRLFVPILFLFIGLWGLVQALWKLSVLRSRKYTPFFEWLAGN